MRRHHPDTSSDSDEDRYAIVPYRKTEDEFDPAMHARLCFGLGPKREDSERFLTVRNHGIKPSRTYTDEEIKRFSDIYRDYFRGLTGIQ
jgi:hypothetical protein